MSQPVIAPEWTKLHWAAWRADANTLSSFLLRGTNLQIRDVDGWTALHCAAANDLYGECVTLLLKAGARIDSKSSSGVTALHVAAGRNNTTAVEALLAAGASNDCVDYDDKSPMDYATSEVIKEMLGSKNTQEQ